MRASVIVCLLLALVAVSYAEMDNGDVLSLAALKNTVWKTSCEAVEFPFAVAFNGTNNETTTELWVSSSLNFIPSYSFRSGDRTLVRKVGALKVRHEFYTRSGCKGNDGIAIEVTGRLRPRDPSRGDGASFVTYRTEIITVDGVNSNRPVFLGQALGTALDKVCGLSGVPDEEFDGFQYDCPELGLHTRQGCKVRANWWSLEKHSTRPTITVDSIVGHCTNSPGRNNMLNGNGPYHPIEYTLTRGSIF